MPRRLFLVALICACVATTGCGGQSDAGRRSSSPRPTVTAPIPGVPDVPVWLRIRIWRIAAGLGDPRPAKIAVTLNLHERGRVVDRVWMRGQFVCDTCVWSGRTTFHLVGYTFDAATHDTISTSGQGP